MQEAQVVPAVRRFFRGPWGLSARSMFAERARGRLALRAAFVQPRSDDIHAVEAKAPRNGAFRAAEQVLGYPANCRGIAFPAGERVPGAGSLEGGSEDGIGVPPVQERFRRPVEVKRWPAHEAETSLDDRLRLGRASCGGTETSVGPNGGPERDASDRFKPQTWFRERVRWRYGGSTDALSRMPS